MIPECLPVSTEGSQEDTDFADPPQQILNFILESGTSDVIIYPGKSNNPLSTSIGRKYWKIRAFNTVLSFLILVTDSYDGLKTIICFLPVLTSSMETLVSPSFPVSLCGK